MIQPLVSVVTPSYNQGRFLEETIQSVLHQDYEPIQYLVIDGGSTDGSLEIIHRYRDRLTDWVSEPDAGQADAINKGWRRSSGTIVAYLNSDDAYVPGAVRDAVGYFSAHPEVDVAYGDRCVVDEHSKVKAIVAAPDFSLDTQIAESLPQECVFFRRRALDAVGLLNSDLSYLMDYDLWLRMLRAGCRFAHVPRVWARYRVHDAAKSTSQRLGFWRELLTVLEAYLTTDPRVPVPLAQVTRSRLYFQAGLELACGGEWEEGGLHVRQSFAHGVLPFAAPSALAARAANIVVNALLSSRFDRQPEDLFDWLSVQIPSMAAREAIVSELGVVRRRAAADYHLAKAFDHYARGEFETVPRHLFASIRRHPAALTNRGAWSIGARSLLAALLGKTAPPMVRIRRVATFFSGVGRSKRADR